jgi:hypothetical protein
MNRQFSKSKKFLDQMTSHSINLKKKQKKSFLLWSELVMPHPLFF